MAAVYGALSLIIVPVFLIAALAGAFANAGNKANVFGPAVALVFALLLPFLYAAIGFVGGALSAFVYNLIAQWLGGIELELQPSPASLPGSAR